MASNNRFSQMACLKNKVCHDCGNCPEIAGLGEHILKNVNEHIANMHLRKLSIDLDILPHWKDIGQLMLSWGCIPKSRVSRAS
ncbi:hypothetical protein [Pseudoalteromonas sp. B62]|uniref:hypothetical protein n=1 Tax=Pseudoalteromonas sp. B62 TaxID=630483 RepID=UPI00301DA149